MLLAGNFPYGNEFNAPAGNDIDVVQPLQDVVIGDQASNDSFIERVLEVFGFDVGSVGAGSQATSIFSYIQSIINIALGLLAFISVLILIYNFFMILFSKEKEGIENAQKALKNVTYVLLIIGSSWLIVSFLFRVVGRFIS